MEICFDSKTQIIYRELDHQVKRVQECAESVVPDVNDDIGRVASIQTAVFLKSKDINGRGVVISGEATAALLYITENENSVSYVNIAKQFSIEYEVSDIQVDSVAHINLSIVNTEARILNPRKVSVTFELCGELSCYTQEEIKVETSLPIMAACQLHAKYESVDAIFANSVCEKTFTVSEQYAFPGGKPAPAKLVSQTADLSVGDIQLIGSKIVIKGIMNLSVCYLSNEVNYPVKADFSSPFSQIIDIGTESMVSCSSVIALTSVYYDLIDSINGEKTLSAELHAVVQLVSRFRQEIKYISDIYSNLMPVECCVESSRIRSLSELKRMKLTTDERICVVEDCMDVLSVFSSVSQTTMMQGRLCASVTLDIVYRCNSGSLSAVRRMVTMECDYDTAASRLMGLRLIDIYLRPDGAYIDAHITLEATYQSCMNIEINGVISVMLNEECPLDFRKFPTLTLVRAGEESLWELAKEYHSSVDKIEAVNNLEGGSMGMLLLVPKVE